MSLQQPLRSRRFTATIWVIYLTSRLNSGMAPAEGLVTCWGLLGGESADFDLPRFDLPRAMDDEDRVEEQRDPRAVYRSVYNVNCLGMKSAENKHRNTIQWCKGNMGACHALAPGSTPG